MYIYVLYMWKHVAQAWSLARPQVLAPASQRCTVISWAQAAENTWENIWKYLVGATWNMNLFSFIDFMIILNIWIILHDFIWFWQFSVETDIFFQRGRCITNQLFNDSITIPKSKEHFSGMLVEFSDGTGWCPVCTGSWVSAPGFQLVSSRESWAATGITGSVWKWCIPAKELLVPAGNLT